MDEKKVIIKLKITVAILICLLCFTSFMWGNTAKKLDIQKQATFGICETHNALADVTNKCTDTLYSFTNMSFNKITDINCIGFIVK